VRVIRVCKLVSNKTILVFIQVKTGASITAKNIC